VLCAITAVLEIERSIGTATWDKMAVIVYCRPGHAGWGESRIQQKKTAEDGAGLHAYTRARGQRMVYVH
jgi:hypothetical protein